MWGLTLLVHMAIANKVDTINLPTYLFLFITPLLLFYLTSTITRLLPVDRRILAKLLITPRPPGLQGRSQCLPPRPRGCGPRNWPLRTHNRRHIVSVYCFVQAQERKNKWKTYLFCFLCTTFRVGCCIELAYRYAIKWLHALRQPCQAVCVALQANGRSACSNDVRFDSDSFAVGVDSHASRCMGNNKGLFDNLILAHTSQRLGGISKGLAIQGKCTLVININDNNSKLH